jgi:hypothetical protein
MSVLQGAGNLPRPLSSFVDRNTLLQFFRQRIAIDQSIRNIGMVFHKTDVKHGNNVGVIQFGDQSSLSHKAIHGRLLPGHRNLQHHVPF